MLSAILIIVEVVLIYNTFTTHSTIIRILLLIPICFLGVWLFISLLIDTNLRPDEEDKRKVKESLEKQQKVQHVGAPRPERTNTNENKVQNCAVQKREDALKEAKDELNNLIGLNNLKQEVDMFVVNMEMMKRKQAAGYKQEKGSLHMVYAGAPGTGKTSVARIIAKMLYGLGYLSKGQCIEVYREKLIAGYVGQTATKTTDVVKSAIGGVLFIDEAYSLTPKPQGFEQECIDTLVALMENNREDLVVIFAGYEEEMKEFLKSNTGLESRVPYMFHFDAYSAQELLEISKVMLKNKSYILSSDAELNLIGSAKDLSVISKDSNGRMIRNFIERLEREQNIRLYNTHSKDLMKIESTDIQKASRYIMLQHTARR